MWQKARKSSIHAAFLAFCFAAFYVAVLGLYIMIFNEDSTLESGKLDEELSRMSEIVDHLSPNALILLNESFAAAIEREGFEIARQIVRALLERQMIFLRAERQADGQRTFQLAEGEPLKTSFGEDLYEKIFCESKQGG